MTTSLADKLQEEINKIDWKCKNLLVLIQDYKENNSFQKASECQIKYRELKIVSRDLKQSVFSHCKREETAELLKEIMTKVKEANRERENGIYDPMIELAKHILNSYRIERK
jgi:hypothetical protein